MRRTSLATVPAGGWPILIGLLLVLLFGTGGPAAAQSAGGDGWRVVSLSGDVALRRNGATPVAFGSDDALRPGDTLQTGPGGRLVLRRGEDTVVVAPNSSVTLPATAPGTLTSLIQSLGTLLVKVDRRATPNFEVRTPYLIAVVKGTSFSVTVDGSGAGVHVLQGQVQVSDVRGGVPPVLLTPGSAARVPAAPGRPMRIDGPARRTMDAAATPPVGDTGDAQAQGSASSALVAIAGPTSMPMNAASSVTSPALPIRDAASTSAASPPAAVVPTVTPVPMIAQPLALAAADAESGSRGLVGNDRDARAKSESKGESRGRSIFAAAERQDDDDDDRDDDKNKNRNQERNENRSQRTVETSSGGISVSASSASSASSVSSASSSGGGSGGGGSGGNRSAFSAAGRAVSSAASVFSAASKGSADIGAAVSSAVSKVGGGGSVGLAVLKVDSEGASESKGKSKGKKRDGHGRRR